MVYLIRLSDSKDTIKLDTPLFNFLDKHTKYLTLCEKEYKNVLYTTLVKNEVPKYIKIANIIPKSLIKDLYVFIIRLHSDRFNYSVTKSIKIYPKQ